MKTTNNSVGAGALDPVAQTAAGPDPPRSGTGAWRWLKVNAGIAAAYIAFALAAGLPTSPAIHTAPIWPAAGLALAAVLIFGARCGAGVWTGSFLYSLSTEVSGTGAAVAALVATGMSVQAIVGFRLTRRLVSASNPLVREADVWRFLLLGGPLACMVSASVGAATLYGAGRVVAADLPARWMAWWVGDALGVLLFTPLLLLAWPREHRLWPGSGARVALPLLITALLLVAGRIGLDQLEDSRAQARIQELMEGVSLTGFTSLPLGILGLEDVGRFFAASEEVTPREFFTFTAQMVRDTALHSVDWAPRVASAETEAFETMARRRGMDGYHLFELDADARPTPPGSRAEYFPVLYSVPLGGHFSVLGLDHGFEASRRSAMNAARDRAEAVAARTVPLLRTQRNAILVFVPVYHPDSMPETTSPAARREALRGFVVGEFDVQALFAPLARAAGKRQLRFRVMDATPGDPAQILAGDLSPEAAAGWSREMDFAGRRLRLEMQPGPGFRHAPGLRNAFILPGTSVLAGFLVVFATLGAAGRTAATEARVAERTAALNRELAARRAAEAALEEREEDLRITLRSIGDAVLATDAQGLVTRMNPIAERLTGWPEAEARGLPVDRVFRIINEETRAPAHVPVADVLRTGEIHGLANHTVLIARDAGEYPIADSAAPIRDADGEVRGVVLVFRDVAQEREAAQALQASERRYRNFIDMAPYGVFVQSGGRFAFVNPKAVEILGADSEMEILGRPVLDFLHPESRNAVSARIRRLNEERVRVAPLEAHWLRMDGTSFHGEATAVPYEHEGRPGALVLLQDISERREIIAELTRAREEAEQANRAKSAFLATMSHEIRTPMNGVIGMVDVLTHTRLSEHQAELVRTVRASAASLLGIIDDILDFSKIEAGRLHLEREALSVTALVEDLCSSLVPIAMKRGVDLELFLSPEIPARIMADEVRLRQVLYNLVGNAIKFSTGSPERRGRVGIRADLAGDRPLRLAFTISDNGIGMAPETMDHLFTAFTQAEISTTRRFGGTGLGLAICKRLVDLMEGEIAVESALGAGTKFTVTLPFEIAAEQPTPSGTDLSGLQCIMVDGPGHDAEGLRLYLEHAGVRVHPVADVAAAASEAARLPAPVVVIQFTGHRRPSPETLRKAFAGVGDVRHLLVSRGDLRRSVRIRAQDVVSLDGNVLRRHAVLNAFAVASGRASPEVVDQETDHGRAGEAAVPPSPAEARAGGRLILVAEDDDINQKVILQQLALLGYAAEIAADGREALARWRAGGYGLLITDLHMPEMDGYALAEAIRHEEAVAERERIPIIALTANALRGEAGRAHAAGMDAYLTKPVPLPRLQEALEAWLPAPGVSRSPPAAQPADTGGQEAAAVDTSVLKSLVGNSAETLREFLDDYLASARTLAAELRNAGAAGDARAAAAAAHKLKSSSRSVGALALGELCAAIETAGRDGDGAAVARRLEPFEQALAAVEKEIAGIRKQT